MKSFWKFALTIALGCLISQSFAQQKTRIKENREGRLAHEYQMYRNPVTEKIPDSIRQKELQFVQSQQAGLDARLRPQASARIEAVQTWEQRGPFNQAGRTKAIGIDARDEKILLAGGTSGGMYRTTDSGESWTLVSGTLDNPAITGVAQNPLAQDTWYYITGEAKESVNTNQSFQSYLGSGAFKSTDNGTTWTQLTSTLPENLAVLGDGARSEWQLCSDIAIDPIDGAILVANIGGIYRSSDEGVSWTLVLDADGDARFGDVVHLDVVKVDASSRVYYAGTHSSGSNKGFFRSEDGVSWSSIGLPSGFAGTYERIRVSIAPSNTDVVWFLARGDALFPENELLLKYKHSTTTWTDRSDKIPSVGGDVGDFNTQGSYNMVIRVKPDDENTIFIGDTKLWRTTDGFASTANAANTGNTTWIGGYSPDNDVSTYPDHHPDVHELIFFPDDPQKALCGHDGGVSVTTNITASNGVPSGFSKPHPVTWTILNNGLYTTQAYAIAIDPSSENSAAIVAGFQDNGNFSTTNISGTANWSEEPYGGDGAWNAIASGGDTWYISQQFGTVERNSSTISAGPGVNPSAAGSSSTNTFISPFILDRNDSDIMYYAAKKELWRNNTISTINVGGHPFNGTSEGWTNLDFSSSVGGNITALETSVSPANVVYLGTSLGNVYRIADAHTGSSVTLTDISTGKGLSSGFISSIDVDPDNADHVYITFSNYEIISIFRSTDAGDTWTDISGNLEENVDGSGAGPAVRWIHVFKKTDDTNVYLVGATTGLYSTATLDGTNTVWTQEGSESIGNVPVSMIRSRKVDGYVTVGTHGKGMFSTNILSTDDFTAPTISSTVPADDATDILLEADLSITFSENIVDAGAALILKQSEDDAVVESFLISAGNVQIIDEVVTINPTQDLLSGTGYYVEIEPTAFKDEGGNRFAGISDKAIWNFITVIPLNAGVKVPKNEMMVTVFDRGINLEFLGQSIQYAEVNVFGIDGKSAAYTSRSSFKNNSVNIKAQLVPGVYIVKASTAKGVYSQKFLVAE